MEHSIRLMKIRGGKSKMTINDDLSLGCTALWTFEGARPVEICLTIFLEVVDYVHVDTL
jgi:hypothetical protein